MGQQLPNTKFYRRKVVLNLLRTLIKRKKKQPKFSHQTGTLFVDALSCSLLHLFEDVTQSLNL